MNTKYIIIIFSVIFTISMLLLILHFTIDLFGVNKETTKKIYIIEEKESSTLPILTSKNMPDSIETFTIVPNLHNVTDVSFGNGFTALINNNQLYTTGRNSYKSIDSNTMYKGLLGFNAGSNDYFTNRFMIVPDVPNEFTNKNISMVSSGRHHTAILTTDGKLYTYGWNIAGQLGLGHYTNTITPQLVTFNGKIKYVTCNSDMTSFITEDNKLYTCGNNKYGQLGYVTQPDTTNPVTTQVPKVKIYFKNISNTFKHVSTVNNVRSMSCNDFNNIIVTNDNLLYICGKNYSFIDNLINPILSTESKKTYDNIYIPKQIIGMTDVKSAYMSGFTIYILTNNGLLYYIGISNIIAFFPKNLGIKEEWHDGDYSVEILESEKNNRKREIYLIQNNSKFTNGTINSMDVGIRNIIFTNNVGKTYEWDLSNEYPFLIPFENISSYKSSSFALADGITTNKNLYVKGNNYGGELGIGQIECKCT
jgi:hypothetical protein